MGPLIDAELERTDRRHAQLTRLSHELVNTTIPHWSILPFALQVDALSLYHNLMREAPAPQYYGGFPGAVPPPGVVGGPPGQPMGGYMPMPGGPPPPHQHMGQQQGLPQHLPPQNGGTPPTYYQAVDPSLYPGYQGPPGMMPGSAPPPTPPLQTEPPMWSCDSNFSTTFPLRRNRPAVPAL